MFNLVFFMNKLLDIKNIDDIDFKNIGLLCGIEVHQQLNTGKLFCRCPCDVVSNEKLDRDIERRLRFSLGEVGDVDKAAVNEFKKGKFNVYKYNDGVTCLVDLDEEPPCGPDKKALETSLKVSKMLHMNVFSKLQFMRKLIIDGSITSGFQRTGLIGVGGKLETSFGDVSIDAVSLEEDSCRTIDKKEGHTVFALDRQGIPLIEITTGPHCNHPDQVYELALQIGNLLRSFKETRRGLGTIRQDLNVSINGGARIEIKGAQNLKLIPDIVKDEARRQMVHISVIEELKKRGINSDNFSDGIVHDITDIFSDTGSDVIKKNLSSEGTGVFAVKLNKFAGVLCCEMQDNYRFATEISERNKHHFPSIKGLFHTDELPKYGITEEEVRRVSERLGMKEEDSFIMIANDDDTVKKSMNYIIEIISELIGKIPSEVRMVDPKGTLTRFLRPMPGAARMYPETDVPDVLIGDDIMNEICDDIPELYDVKLDRIKDGLGIEKSKTEHFLNRFSEDEIMELIRESGKNAAYVYNVVFEIPKDIKKRDNIEIGEIKFGLMIDLMKMNKSCKLNQKTMRDILVCLFRDGITEGLNLEKYVNEKCLIGPQIDDDEIEKKVNEIINDNPGVPFGALMGMAMKAFKGNADGKKINEILKKILNDTIL